MKKLFIVVLLVPLFLISCEKNENVKIVSNPPIIEKQVTETTSGKVITGSNTEKTEEISTGVISEKTEEISTGVISEKNSESISGSGKELIVKNCISTKEINKIKEEYTNSPFKIIEGKIYKGEIELSKGIKINFDENGSKGDYSIPGTFNYFNDFILYEGGKIIVGRMTVYRTGAGPGAGYYIFNTENGKYFKMGFSSESQLKDAKNDNENKFWTDFYKQIGSNTSVYAFGIKEIKDSKLIISLNDNFYNGISFDKLSYGQILEKLWYQEGEENLIIPLENSIRYFCDEKEYFNKKDNKEFIIDISKYF